MSENTVSFQVSGDPTEEETAAIVAAFQTTQGNNTTLSETSEVPRWRFAGRWWSKPLPARRDRP